MLIKADQGKSMLVEASRDRSRLSEADQYYYGYSGRSRQIKGDKSRSLLIEAEHGCHLIKAKLMADDG
eukprot:g50262.t1